MSDIRIENGFKVVSPGGSASWTSGQLKVPDGTVVKALEPRIVFIVTAAAPDANGMALAAQEALLAAVEMTLKTDTKTKTPQTPINAQTLAEMRYDAAAVLERDIVGGPGEATSIVGEKGLGAALVAGQNRLVVALPISFGHIEFINESTKLYGAGHSQLLDMDLGVKFARDVIKAIDSNVEVTGYEIDLRVVPQRNISDGEPESPIPAIVIVKGGEQNDVETPEGVVFTGNDTNADLDGTAIKELTVSVGGQEVTTDPAEPKDINARFQNQAETSATEVSVSNKWTDLYRVGDTDLKGIKPGAVKVVMDEHDVNLDTRWSMFRSSTSKEGLQRIRARADREASGGYIHAVNAAAVEKVEVTDEQLPFTGWRYFRSDKARFHTMAGVRCKKGDKPFLYIPPPLLMEIAAAYRMANADVNGDDTSAKAQSLAVLVEYGKSIPCLFEGALGAPPNGPVTQAFETFKRMVDDFNADRAAALAKQPEPTAQRRAELKRAGKDPNQLYALDI